MWQEIFDELQLEPLYILTIRHPGSVAASLSKRNRLAFSHSQAVWLKTYLDVLSYTGNNVRAIVDYDRWFDSGLEQARTLIDSLDLSLSVNETQLIEALNLVVSPGLRHHSNDEDVICSPVVTKFYSMMLHASVNGKIPIGVSDITTTFEKSKDLLHIWEDMFTGQYAIIAEHETTILQRNEKIEQCNDKIKQYNDKIKQCNDKIAHLRNHRKLLIYLMIFIIAAFALYLHMDLLAPATGSNDQPRPSNRKFIFIFP